MSYAAILIETRERVGLITFNRPQALNVLNFILPTELVKALSPFDADDSIGAVVITRGERFFAAGADIKALADATVAEMLTNGYIELFAIENQKKGCVLFLKNEKPSGQ